MYTVDLLVEGRPVESIAAQDVVDLKARMEKLERVAEVARKVLIINDDERLVQTVHYTCGCFVLVEEDAEPPQTKCPHCELVDALEALDGDVCGAEIPVPSETGVE